MQYVFILGLVFVCIFFLVMVILSAKTWRWLHVVATLFVFAMAVMYTSFVAMSGKTRNAWIERAEINEERVNELKSQIEELTLGPEEGIRFGEVSTKNLLMTRDREILGRGRVWRRCQPTNIAQDWSQVVVSTVPSTAADPGNYPPNGIEIGSLLYVFAEGPPLNAPEATYLVPRVYVGEFSVIAADAQNVTLNVNLLIGDQAELNIARNSPWSLYELMPQDRHDAFDDLLAMFYEPGIDHPEQLSDRQLVERRQAMIANFPNLNQIFPDAAAPQDQTAVLAAREAFIDRFAFDDLPFPKIEELIRNDGNRIITTFDPPLEETWVRIKMKDDLPDRFRKVDVDDEALAGTGLEGQDFGSQGRASVRSLRQGYDSEVIEGDELVIDVWNAVLGYEDNPNPLVPNLADKVYDVYRRTLNDFEYEFHQLAIRTQFLDRKIAQVKRDIQFTEAAFTNAQSQITERERMRDDNLEDIENFDRDLMLASTHREDLERAVDAKRREINRLYAATRELAQQKAEIESLLKAHIDRKTQEALDGLGGE